MQNKIIFFLFFIIAAFASTAWFMIYQDTITDTPSDLSTATSTEGGITIVSSSTLGNPKEKSLQATSTSTATEPVEATDTAIYTGSETPGNQFYIDYANLTEDGFIVIYENGAEPMGEVLGTSVYLPRGEYTNVPISLARTVTHGEVFDAVLHKDNGDRTFNILTDGLFKNNSGFGVITHISVLDVPSS
jgi:hypothetical protein